MSHQMITELIQDYKEEISTILTGYSVLGAIIILLNMVELKELVRAFNLP